MAIEPPSQSLLNSLRSLNLANEAQLRACQKHLKNLVRDLPAFDSVWIDALVQSEVLTPFQGKLLTQSPESLRLGSYVLVDRLPHDGWPVRYQAVPLKGGRAVAIAVLPIDQAELPAVRDRFARHVTSVQALNHRNLCLATAYEECDESLQAISPLSPGEPLDELFVRRGRFPAEVVEEIARQALDGLARLELAGTLHGDLRMRNLLLTPQGRIQIINAGLIAAAHPQITIHTTLPVACYQGIAPELIGGRTERSPATEMYALGCLLWHLLAGRAPFLPADPLEQLAAHQSGTIPDVRTMAPDTPSSLAALIARLVARHPSERYRSLTIAATECGGSTARGRARLSQFQASFQTMVPVRLGQSAKTRKTARLQSTLTAAVLLGATALFLFPGAGQSLLQSAGRMLKATQEPTTTSPAPLSKPVEVASVATVEAPPASVPTPKTEPIASGTLLQETSKHSGKIILNTPGPYAAGAFSNVGDLRIQAAEGVRPVIEIHDQPLQLAGRRVILENVIIRRGTNSTPGIPLLDIDTQSLSLTGCELRSGPALQGVSEGDSNHSINPAIAWQNLEENDVQPAMLECSECLFVGGAAVLYCTSVPQSVRLTDTVCLATGPLCEIAHAPGPRTLSLALTRSTLRQTGPLLREREITSKKQTPVDIELRQSVLELHPEVAVVEAIGTAGSNWKPKVKIESTGSYLLEGTAYVATKTDDESELIALDQEKLDIEGLMTAQFEFKGPISNRWSDNVLSRYTAEVQSDELPGISSRETKVPSPQRRQQIPATVKP
ncbi:MAG: serine/threonine-protein kinase [Planctomycetaceae bacterium]